MRIGIVNDMRLACEALRRVLGSATGHKVVWTATDGAQALDLARQDRPDVILMDLIMPRVDGAEATRRIMAEAPCAILVVTSSVTGNISKVYEAMGYGALDAVDTPVLGIGGKLEGASALLHKLNLFEKLLNKAAASPPTVSARIEMPTRVMTSARDAIAVPLVAIGASTGGPKIIALILSELPRNFPACVIVVQHVDSAFAPGLATWLGQQSRLPVRLAAPGQEPVPGQVLLAKTGDHLILTPNRRLGYTAEPRDQCFRPSVDVFFQSLARHWPQPGVAVLLTGMGRDGADGMYALKKAGWHTIAQDQASSTVWGMPKAACEIGAVAQVLSPLDIAQSILGRLLKRPTA